MRNSPQMMAHSMGNSGEKVQVANPRATGRRVLTFTRPYRTMVVGFVLVIVIESLLQLVSPLLFGRIIDHAIERSDTSELNKLAAIIVAAAIAESGFSLLERYWSSRIGEGLILDLRVALFDHVQRLPLSFFTRTQTGALVSRTNNDVIGAQRAVTGTLGSVVSNMITLVTVLTAMVILEWRLTLLAIVMLPLFVIPARRVGKRLSEITREGMDLNASMNTQMTERFNVAGALLVKLFGNHDRERTEFSNRADRVRAVGVRSAMYNRTFVTALTLVGSLGTAAIYWIGGNFVINGSMTPGQLISLSLLVTRVYGPLTSLSSTRVDVMSALVSFERVFEVLDAPNPISDRPDAIALEATRGEIAFEQVSFRYPDASAVSVPSLEFAGPPTSSRPSETVLNDINLTIYPGQLVALVGPSGAGKSTLSSLIPRLYDVTSGRILVDGHDIRDLLQDSLRASVGVVSQDPHLFHDTIGANLRFARPDATDAELDEACRAAQIASVIDALPDGYDTVVGERGYRLSGGEKQRLSIARMLVKDPAIVVLDEATSHLDSENESLVQQALANALSGRTAIVIAHRLSTIVDADLIVVLDRGTVVESGKHAELRAAGGLYADLYNTLVRNPNADPADLPMNLVPEA